MYQSNKSRESFAIGAHNYSITCKCTKLCVQNYVCMSIALKSMYFVSLTEVFEPSVLSCYIVNCDLSCMVGVVNDEDEHHREIMVVIIMISVMLKKNS